MTRRRRRVYRGVSSKHLQSYLDEYVFRYITTGKTRSGVQLGGPPHLAHIFQEI